MKSYWRWFSNLHYVSVFMPTRNKQAND